MDCDLFSQSLGYIGKTTYTLKYLENTKDYSCRWPRCSIFHHRSREKLLESIFSQDVGIDRSFAYSDTCDVLTNILGQFLKCHERTNYKEILKKCKEQNKNSKQVSVSRRVIKEYIHRIIFNVIPLGLFGTKINAIQFEKNFRKIIFLGKYQVFSLSMVLHRIRVKHIPFLRPINCYNNKTNLFAKLFIWLLQMYILTALKCVFYVTESNHSNKYVFYEKQVWKKIQHRRMKKIKKQVLGLHKHCIISGIIKSNHLYTVKLLPKRCGSRPIFMKLEKENNWKMKCNLARRTAEILLHRVADDYFKNVHSSWRVFHEKWLSFHEKWKSNSQPLVYFVRTDFTDAFASINLTKLTEIFRKIRENADDLTDLRFRFQGWLKNVPLNSAFKILENYANGFIFKHYDKVYRLTGGLCQGGPLSCQLYNLYLGEWEKLYLSEYVEDKRGFFIRNCDDCLYFTMDHGKASSYLRLMEEGFPEFNLFVNLKKTETNIRNECKVSVTFCNYVLDLNIFQIYGSYEFYRDSSFFHSSRIFSLESPGKTILKRIGRPCMMKLSKVFLDSAYNTTHTILYNVFMAASISAAKCLVYMERIFSHFNEGFIMSCFALCSRRIARVVQDSLKSDVDINQTMLQWMVIKAFQVRLQALKSKNFTRITLSCCGFLKNLFKNLNDKQKEIISEFFYVQQPDPIKSLQY